jgi:hypothetical protein
MRLDSLAKKSELWLNARRNMMLTVEKKTKHLSDQIRDKDTHTHVDDRPPPPRARGSFWFCHTCITHDRIRCVQCMPLHICEHTAGCTLHVRRRCMPWPPRGPCATRTRARRQGSTMYRVRTDVRVTTAR